MNYLKRVGSNLVMLLRHCGESLLLVAVISLLMILYVLVVLVTLPCLVLIALFGTKMPKVISDRAAINKLKDSLKQVK